MCHAWLGSVRPVRVLLLAAATGLLCGCNAMTGGVMNQSGSACYRQGNYSLARAEFQRAVIERPDNANYIHNLAAAMRKQGDQAGAEQTYRRALLVDPMHQPAHHGLAKLLMDQNRHGEAIALLEDWTGAQPYVPESHIELAWIQRETGDIASAERSLQNALRIAPNHPVALAHLGQVYETTGDRGRAMAMYQRSLYSRWNQPQVQSRLATLAGTSHPGAARTVSLNPAAPIRGYAMSNPPAPGYVMSQPQQGYVMSQPQRFVQQSVARIPTHQPVTLAPPQPVYEQPTSFAPSTTRVVAAPVQLGLPAFDADPAHSQQMTAASLPVVDPY